MPILYEVGLSIPVCHAKLLSQWWVWWGWGPQPWLPLPSVPRWGGRAGRQPPHWILAVTPGPADLMTSGPPPRTLPWYPPHQAHKRHADLSWAFLLGLFRAVSTTNILHPPTGLDTLGWTYSTARIPVTSVWCLCLAHPYLHRVGTS